MLVARITAGFFLLWVLVGVLLVAFDHYVAGGLMIGTYMGLSVWSVLRVTKE